MSQDKAMVDATIKLIVSKEKRKEVLQAFTEILDPIRRERGCISCHCYVDVESENSFFFREEWRSSEDLNSHLRSVHFAVLIGAMKLLSEDPDIRFNTVASTAGVEAIEAARES
jgi:quinol monooxygenase YgiN